MAYDLVIKNGTVVDGGARTIDASDLIVAPGYVDRIHDRSPARVAQHVRVGLSSSSDASRHASGRP